MNLNHYSDAGPFLEHAQPFLEAEESKNSLILGITTRLKEFPEWVDTPPYLAVVEDTAGSPVLAAAMTPPHELILAAAADVPQTALDLVASSLRAGSWPVPGVNGESLISGRFAQTWEKVAGQKAAVRMRLRAYEVRNVILPENPPSGVLRLAEPADLDRIAEWRAAFERESLHNEPPPDYRQIIERIILAGNMYLWDDRGPVSMAARTRPTAHGVSIGAVYTPPELRGRGYASICVAAISQRQLEAGKEFCALFTDLDYPTSNAIYQRIGYQPVCDFTAYRFND